MENIIGSKNPTLAISPTHIIPKADVNNIQVNALIPRCIDRLGNNCAAHVWVELINDSAIGLQEILNILDDRFINLRQIERLTHI